MDPVIGLDAASDELVMSSHAGDGMTVAKLGVELQTVHIELLVAQMLDFGGSLQP